MLVFKHKKSRKNFVFIEGLDDGSLYVINPNGKPMPMDYSSFIDDDEEGSSEKFLADGQITKAQLERYKTIKPGRDNERQLRDFMAKFNRWPRAKQIQVLNELRNFNKKLEELRDIPPSE